MSNDVLFSGVHVNRLPVTNYCPTKPRERWISRLHLASLNPAAVRNIAKHGIPISKTLNPKPDPIIFILYCVLKYLCRIISVTIHKRYHQFIGIVYSMAQLNKDTKSLVPTFQLLQSSQRPVDDSRFDMLSISQKWLFSICTKPLTLN